MVRADQGARLRRRAGVGSGVNTAIQLRGQAVNHYPRHLGDYIRDTVGLTMLEDGAYTRLLDQYYVREAPLPADKEMLYRIARATSKAERQAVDSILLQFFTDGPDGWRQKRADMELQAQSERSASARESAKRKWEKHHANAHANAMRTHIPTHNEGICEPPAESMLASSHRTTSKEESKSTAMSSSAEKPPNVDVISLPPGSKNTERREQARQILGFLNAKTNKNFRLVDSNLGPIMARMKEGATIRELRAVIARKCREWGLDEKMSQYLRPATLFNATKFAQYVGEVPPAEMEAIDVPAMP